MGHILHTILLVGILVAAAGTLGVAIAILVNVVNNSNNNNNNNSNNNNGIDNAAKLLNIPERKIISTTDPRYQSYMQVVQLFNNSIDTSINPCEDFYAYTCGNFKGDMSFDISDNSNMADMISQILEEHYIKNSPKPVQQTRWYFDQCVAARKNWTSLVADGKQVTNAINKLASGVTPIGNFTKFPFPMLDQSTNVTEFPDNQGLGYLVGSLSAAGIDTIISPGVDTNWKDPSGPNGFAYLIDQPTTFYPYTYYIKNWKATKASLKAAITDTMNTLAKVQSKVLDQQILENDVNAIVTLDYLLATHFSTNDTARRQYARSYNPQTIQGLQTFQGDTFSWKTFVQLATASSPDTVTKVLNPDYNYYIVMEPYNLNLLLSNLKDNNIYGIKPRTLVNYLYYRLVDANSEFLPSSSSITIRPIVKIAKQPVGRPRHITPEMRKFSRKQLDDSEAQFSCIAETIDMMQYANARIFIDNIYPTAESRQLVREHVAKVANSILIGFRSMIDQLNWMTSSTKTGAYNKIENLVKNIAYPDWITDDALLSNYHANMTFSQTDSYFDMLSAATTFNMYSQWIQLVQGAADRTGFNGPPGVTNAWYQPELNSITFPAGILKRPFYDFNWPASVNFGAMGVIAGHELTHGFDDQGVQWNGVGALNGWMDDTSKGNFTTMATCVVDEYAQFCPLDKSEYGDAACVDGAQTQGENIADNGGIHSAFRAYKNYINLYGPDDNLPDDTLQYFTADQLFFLSFAQIWCQLPPSDSQFLRQMLVDVHSPSIYRVRGTIQNFPAFKTAFNCPSSVYAPDTHCNVWVSDVETTFGLPNVKTDLNIEPLPQITSRDVPKMNAFQMAVDYYSASVNTSVNPCDDFFSYACGAFNQPVSFTTARARNLVYMSQQLEDPTYQSTIKNVSALKKEKMFYDACLNATSSSQTETQILIQKNYIQKKIDTLAALIGSNFTLVTGSIQNISLPNKSQLAKSLGFLSFSEGIDTLISPLVDTYWIDNSQGYQMFIDQNTAYYAKTYYQRNAWNIKKPQYLSMADDVLQRYAKEQSIQLPANYKNLLSDILDYEKLIAVKYSTDDTVRREYKRSWNLKAVNTLDKTYSFIDWSSYLNYVPEVVRSKVTDPSYNLSIMEVDQLRSFSNDYAAQNPTLLVNLLFLRLLLGNTQYIPSYASEFRDSAEPSILLGLSRRKTLENFRFESFGDDASQNGPACAGVANELMQFANGRVFIDYMYPDQNASTIRQLPGAIISNVITSFQGMLDQLDWMSTSNKATAYNKTAAILKNIAFPDWIRENDNLDKYYENLIINETDNYFDIFDKLVKFNIYLQYNQLTFKKTDRSDFLGQPGTVNAWYQPELNSITFPAGILVPPYYHPEWPPSINYGGMGLVAGHELTHGFDDEGVQWDLTGNLHPWMDNSTKAKFANMTNCVIEEYSNFCPLNSQFSPNCVNGEQTQGENIADNGGIHAAFNAYRTHSALDGPDPLLPDRLFGQFTHDQLFFLSFAQVWCEVRRTDEALYTQLMVDPHSPAMYRVQGAIQNFPAFQTAFNCPLGSNSAPSEHCNVWVPNKYQ